MCCNDKTTLKATAASKIIAGIIRLCFQNLVTIKSREQTPTENIQAKTGTLINKVWVVSNSETPINIFQLPLINMHPVPPKKPPRTWYGIARK